MTQRTASLDAASHPHSRARLARLCPKRSGKSRHCVAECPENGEARGRGHAGESGENLQRGEVGRRRGTAEKGENCRGRGQSIDEDEM